MATATIKIELVTPNGPRVTYDVLDQPEEIDAEAAKHGLRVDYSSQVKIGFGSTTYRAPLVALEDGDG